MAGNVAKYLSLNTDVEYYSVVRYWFDNPTTSKRKVILLQPPIDRCKQLVEHVVHTI